MPSHRRRQPGLGVLLLLYQIFQVIGIDRIPPVTLSVVGIQVATYLRLFAVPWRKASQICVSAYKVWHKREYMRLLYAAFEHGDDWHLYYNMVSFVWKGLTLERRLGSVKFLYVLSVFTLLTNITLVALCEIADGFKPLRNYGNQCAIGFSGVIFALKVLTTHYDPNYTNQIMGIPIVLPAKYAVWAELILIQILVPNVSFFGHLAGILVGMAYVKGPLKYMMDLLYSMVTGVANPQPQRARFTPRAEATGYADNQYAPSSMSEEEQFAEAVAASLRENHPSFGHSSSYPSSSNASPPYPSPPYPSSSHPSSSHPSSSHPSSPPPPGFVFENYDDAQSFTPPPPPGFSPDIEELRNKRQTRFAYS